MNFIVDNDKLMDTEIVMSCAEFNFGSAFGYAVYNPVDKCVELRAQVPESGGISDAEQYRHIFELFVYAMGELRETLGE